MSERAKPCFISIISLLFVIIVGFYSKVEAKEILMIFGGEYPPFHFNKMQTGIYNDFLTTFEKRYPEFTIRRKHLPRKRLNLKFKKKEPFVHALNSPSFTKDKSILASYSFAKTIFTTGDYILMRKDKKFSYSQPLDLSGKKVGVLLGYKYGDLDPYLASGRIKSQRLSKSFQLYQMLSLGRLDAIIINKHVGPFEIKLNGIDFSQFVFAKIPLYEFELTPLIHNSYSEFLEKMNTFIDESLKDGLLKELSQKYLE